ncbi:hypothetical protein K9N08_00290 [Candidatus Gracilibacteria bacterium]|nr:hypothetical protein [Candidatus Gracilibacteria bacterium]MCF7855987.1 hypothetical protein [Candidatus Gracilibacteria bacterium]MCF7896320.1 hypothetical protein [Candidatus Gracilibacteria bacterium]
MSCIDKIGEKALEKECGIKMIIKHSIDFSAKPDSDINKKIKQLHTELQKNYRPKFRSIAEKILDLNPEEKDEEKLIQKIIDQFYREIAAPGK